MDFHLLDGPSIAQQLLLALGTWKSWIPYCISSFIFFFFFFVGNIGWRKGSLLTGRPECCPTSQSPSPRNHHQPPLILWVLHYPAAFLLSPLVFITLLLLFFFPSYFSLITTSQRDIFFSLECTTFHIPFKLRV